MFLFWLIMLIMGWWQVANLIDKKQRKELMVFLIFWMIAGVYGSLVLLKIPLISPLEFIEKSINTLGIRI